jgi:hypothetical protein
MFAPGREPLPDLADDSAGGRLQRSVLVTALTLDIGRRMWWPSRLAAGRDDNIADELRGQLTRTR